MSNVVSYIDFKESNRVKVAGTVEEETVSDEEILEASDRVLGVINDNFDDGLLIGIRDGRMQVAATVDDMEEVFWMLEEALQNLIESDGDDYDFS